MNRTLHDKARLTWRTRVTRVLLPVLIVGLAASAASVAAAAARPVSPEDRARITAIENGLLPALVIKGRPLPTETLASRMRATKTPGVSIAFFEDGRIRWTKAYGLADVASGRPVTARTLFQAASVTKPVTAMAALRLVQEGRLSLDEDVDARLRQWKVPTSPFTAERKVTVRGLLSHTSGLGVHGFDGYPSGAALPGVIEILDGGPATNSPPVVSEATPGERWSYSGGGYVVVQLLMTEATGKAFPQLMRDLVLTPAHMTHSTYEQPLPHTLTGQAATGYLPDGQPLPGGRNIYPELGPAGLWTTPSDLARFAISLQNANAGTANVILNKATAQAMLTSQMNNFGLGLYLNPPGSPAGFEHAGNNSGFHAEMRAFATGHRQGVVIMTNGDGGRLLIPEILRAVSQAYDWDVARPEVRNIVAVTPAELATLSGAYAIPGMTKLAVTAKGDRLYVSAPILGPEPLELLPQGRDRFFILSNGVTADFAREPGGAGVSVAISGPLGDFHARRATR